jgi:hypothetical protein
MGKKPIRNHDMSDLTRSMDQEPGTWKKLIYQLILSISRLSNISIVYIGFWWSGT